MRTVTTSLARVTRIHKLSGQWISITRTGGIIQPWFSKSGGSGDGSLVHGRSSPAPEGEGMAPVCEGMDPNVRLWSILEVIHPLPISFSWGTPKKHSHTARNSCHAFLVRQSPSWLAGNFNPSEKYESQLGLLFPIYGKIKAMFQTTNPHDAFGIACPACLLHSCRNG